MFIDRTNERAKEQESRILGVLSEKIGVDRLADNLIDNPILRESIRLIARHHALTHVEA